MTLSFEIPSDHILKQISLRLLKRIQKKEWILLPVKGHEQMKPPADNLLKDWLYTIHQGMSCSFIEYPEWNVLHERVSKSSHTRLFSRSPGGFYKTS